MSTTFFFRRIVKFNFLRRDGIHVNQTTIQKDKRDPLAVYISMKWSPVKSDVGKHIICANAEDSFGYFIFSNQHCHLIQRISL